MRKPTAETPAMPKLNRKTLEDRRAFLDFYDGEDDPNPLLFFEIMHERAAAIRKDLEG